MEKYITDSIYHHKPWERTIEEELNEFYRNLEKEWFYRGFTEGIRFLLDLM